MFYWKTIDTLLLDMDGTLLDLHFDNCFWLSLVQQELSRQRSLSKDEAQQLVVNAYERVVGTLDWYCLDYWQEQLQLDIMGLHRTLVDYMRHKPSSSLFIDGESIINTGKLAGATINFWLKLW